MLSKFKAFAQKIGFFPTTDSVEVAIKEVTSPGELETLVADTYLEKILKTSASQHVEAIKAQLLAVLHPANQSSFFSLGEGVALQFKFKALNAALNEFVTIQRKQEVFLSKLGKSTTTNLQVDKAQDAIDGVLAQKVKALEEALQKAETAYVQTLEKLEDVHKEQLAAKENQIATLTKTYEEKLALTETAFQQELTALSKRMDDRPPIEPSKKEGKPSAKKKEE